MMLSFCPKNPKWGAGFNKTSASVEVAIGVNWIYLAAIAATVALVVMR